MAASAGCRSLSPENLVQDFGPQSSCCRGTIRALYRALAQAPHPLREGLVNSWREETGWGGELGARGRRRQERALAALAEGLDLVETRMELELLLIALHTYFAVLVKLLAAPLLGCDYPPPFEFNVNRTSDWLAKLEKNPFFALGQEDTPLGTTSGWYLEVWSQELAHSLQMVINRLRDYNFSRLGQPREDILQRLYQCLLPPALRHCLGEYYTPPWLVDYLYKLLEPRFFSCGPGGKGLLDPACGSGTFLLGALEWLREEVAHSCLTPGEIVAAASRLVVGVDKNPLAVLAARVNYLLALADLFPVQGGAFLPPVYLGDTILAPPAELTGRKFGYITGNPPWVNWETLPRKYRQQTRPLWSEYGLFRHQGYDALLGKSKDDLAVLLTYVVLDRYLQPDGTLAFVITQSLFKTTGAGQGFRSFTLPGGTPVAVLRVEDLSEIKPFPEAKNRTALLLLRKGRPTVYPVPYIYWQRRSKQKPPRENSSLEEVDQAVRRLPLMARPVDTNDVTSPWITAQRGALTALEKVLAPSIYVAREGVNTGGANGVFYLEVKGLAGEGKVVVQNLTVGTKRPVPKVEAHLEGALIYPLLRGRDIRPWRGEPQAWILLTHRPGGKLQAISEAELASAYPGVAAYLTQFAPILRQRRTRVVRNLMEKGPFYSLFGVGDYTFAPYKVVWFRIGTRITAAVVSRKQVSGPLQDLVIPNDSTVFVPFSREDEAHYFCALINSAPARLVVRTTSVLATGSFASPHVLDKVAIPPFEAANPVHQSLAELAREAAEVASRGEGTEKVEMRIDQKAAQVWGLTPRELEEIRKSLSELDG